MEISEAGRVALAELLVFLLENRAQMWRVMWVGIALAVVGLGGVAHAAWRDHRRGGSE
jgi:hypothetical protein